MLTPLTEYVYAPHDPDDDSCEGLLAVVYRLTKTTEPLDSGAHFITDPSFPLQVGVLIHDEGHVVPTHRHPPVRRTVRGTPEVLVVTDGRYRLSVYSSRGLPAGTLEVGKQEVVVLLAGGHGLECLEEGSILEVKIGPHADGDKLPLFPRKNG